MTDMLVKLYDLPETLSTFSNLVAPDITIRKPIGTEKSLAVKWVRENFEEGWATEMEVSFSRSPTSSYIAQQGRNMVGFACYDTAALGLFGPMGVVESMQGKGIGKALLLACLVEMKIKGYGYAVIGWAGPQDFYAKIAGAVAIPDSTPGIWKNWLGGSE
ncbi:MAG TPA: GNAT family N-acetyltransferase [Anaerolineales bacterium]|jgi:GNAT superfamily N-acetyltransferase|nr:GNAT family N-acetyltransferase [Anaerolineales bacterium]